MATYERQAHFINKEGLLVRLTSVLSLNFNNRYSIWNYAHFRKNENEEWTLCKDQSTFSRQELKQMSREQYLKEGRPELLVVVGIPELLRASQELVEHVKAELSFNITPELPFGGEKSI